MNRGKAPLVTLCERNFILEAVKENKVLSPSDPEINGKLFISLSSLESGW